MDPFYYLYSMIGMSTSSFILMGRMTCYWFHDIDGKVPVAPLGYKQDGECIWEYEILGLWSIGKNWMNSNNE